MRNILNKSAAIKVCLLACAVSAVLFAAPGCKKRNPVSPTLMMTATFNLSNTPTITPTVTPTFTITPTWTNTFTMTVTRTFTSTRISTFTGTWTASPSITQTATATPTATLGWKIVGMQGFGEGTGYSEAFTQYNGVLYAAFSSDLFSGKATVWRFNGSIWEHLGPQGFTQSSANPIALKIYNGTPYIAFGDGTNSKATVMKYNGTDWETVGQAGFSQCMPGYISLQISADGTLYVGYSDTANGRKASVMKYDGTSWSFVGNPDFTSDSTYMSCLRLSDSGIPYIGYKVYQYVYPYNTVVMKFDGVNWVNVGAPGIFTGIFNYMSLFIYGEVPYAADGGMVKNFDGANWVNAASSGYSAGTPAAMYIYNGTPFIVCNGPSVIRYNGTSWEYVGPPGFPSTSGTGNYSMLFINGTPYVIFGSTVFKYDGSF